MRTSPPQKPATEVVMECSVIDGSLWLRELQTVGVY